MTRGRNRRLESSMLFALAGCLALTLVACSGAGPTTALQIQPESLQDRRMQSRAFQVPDERTLLLAAIDLVQDMGYSIERSESGLGVVVASKDRDATDRGEVAGSLLVRALTGVKTAVDKRQNIRVSIVTKPSGSDVTLRATFQRVVWDSEGQISRLEYINDPEIYQEFFERLSKAVFLEVHQL